jgi:hypothetical protein
LRFICFFCCFSIQIAYMDYLDLPSDRGHQINYSLPRICHVSNADFNFVMAVDKNKFSLENSFGRLPVCATLHLHFCRCCSPKFKMFSVIYSSFFNTCCSSIV